MRIPFNLNNNGGIFNSILYCGLFIVLIAGGLVLWETSKEFIYKGIIGEQELNTLLFYSPLIIFYGYFCYSIKNTIDEKSAKQMVVLFGFILTVALMVPRFMGIIA